MPPGSGELGRVSAEWEADSGAADGFRIYLRDCDGSVQFVIEVEPQARTHEPLQPCRPGGDIGVSAFDERGESAITWAHRR
jgi:hypothetical protein